MQYTVFFINPPEIGGIRGQTPNSSISEFGVCPQIPQQSPIGPKNLGSGLPFLSANVVFGRGLKLILAMRAAEIIPRPLVLCLVVGGTLVDFYSTIEVDSYFVI